MSGENCFEILDKIFVAKNPKPIEEIKGYTIKYGNIIENNEIIDEVLVSYFKAPKSYTAENMCEINSHGGNIIEKRILEICLKNGAKLAEPGEFTKRAFLNGRIDLLQAESKDIKEIKEKIMNVMVNVDVAIDYPEYDVDDVTNSEISTMLNEVKQKLTKLEKSFDSGKIIKEGIKTAIIGKPNAGKSSLLNAILKEDRAIVTEIEGTTRDTIEEFVNINGVPLKLIDTAGIRDAKDEVEKIGISKSREIAKEADLVIAIFDSSKELSKEDMEILEIAKNKKSIIILNKMDLETKVDENNEKIKDANSKVIKMSALKKEGIEELYNEISNLFSLNEINLDNEVLITNIRHKNLISKAIKDVKKAKETLDKKMPLDIIAIFMKDILEDLAEITGEEVTEDIIDEIFSKFCLGK